MSVPKTSSSLGRCSTPPPRAPSSAHGGGCFTLAAQPDGEIGDKPPAIKKQFVILASDPENRLPRHDFVAWVLQIPEDESVATTQERIFRGAYDYNASKKGRLYPAKTVGEALENVPAKFFKEAEVWVKSKVPVLVLKTDNTIPRAD